MTRTHTLPILAALALAAGCASAPEAVRVESATATAARQTPPPPLPLEDVDFPDYDERTLSNGARLIVVPNHEQPVLTVDLRLRSGAAADPAGRTGVAGLAAEMLNKGTTTRSANELAESIDFLGADFAAFAGEDWTTVRLTSLTDFLEPGLELMADMVRHPTFPADELETQRRRLLSSLQLERSDPESVAQRVFVERLYGEHPYGRQVTPETVQAITAADLKRFHARHFTPANAMFVVAGAVDADVVARQLETHFGGWSGAAPREDARPAPPSRGGRELVFVHKPGSVQGVIRAGNLLPPATSPDWVAYDVANHIYGANSAAWLFDVLRDQKGWTYGAYARAAERRGPGYLMVDAEARNEVADSALAMSLQLMDRLRAGPIPDHDLERVKSYLTGRFPRTIETPQQVAAQIAENRLLGRPDSYLESYRSRVRDVTKAEVQAAARQLVEPDNALIVVVGDAREILDGLRPLAQRVTLVDVDGRPLARGDIEAPAGGVSFDPASLRPATYTYLLKFQGNVVGEVTRRLSREQLAGRAVFRATEQMTVPMPMKQDVVFGATDFQPLRFELTAGGFGSMALELKDGRVTGQALQIPQGGTKDVDVEVPPGTLLSGMGDYAIAVTDFEANGSFSVPVVTESGELRTVSVRVVGEASVEVPAGTFDTYRLEVTAEQPVTYYVRKAAPHIIVKQEMTTQPVSLELKEIAGP